MACTIERLARQGLIRPPRFLPDNVHYETIMGSVAYGVSSDTSDMDIYGFCIPPKAVLFPHLDGEIPGFGPTRRPFEQYQQHHVEVPDELAGKGRTYDIAIFNIVKYFNLAMENNPNMIDSLFTPQSCVLHQTQIGNLVRESRRLFLHKGCWPKFKGYAYSQLHKMSAKEPEEGSKRHELREQFGFDVKFAYHVVRLLSECEQILAEGDLDLQEKGRREHMKAIRRGDVSEEDIRKWAADKERQLEQLYHDSSLPAVPNIREVKRLLVHCLEQHYGSLADCITQPDEALQALREVQQVLDRHARLLRQ
ncbi:MAG: nucleotidyltransferase [Planctomycetes bacterium]|nr:nucleotidyltransferase [Planctomycetota bacterium]